MTDNGKSYEGWAILELLGHRRLAGRVCQEEQYGVAMIRIDIPGEEGDAATQWYAPGALYALTPTTEAIAREVAKLSRPAPATPWELRAIEAPKVRDEVDPPFNRNYDGEIEDEDGEGLDDEREPPF